MGEVIAGVYAVNKRFTGVHALKDVTLEVAAGQVHCLVGENGAGKSTLVKLFAGVHQPDSGELRIRGRVQRLRSPNEALQQGISTIFQELMLVPDMTVSENVFLGRFPTRAPGILHRRERERRAARLFEEMGIFDIDPRARIRDLGIAHQQIVEIAKALSLEGERMLIMDEPTATLTANEIDRLFALVAQLRRRGVGILYITHRLEELDVVGDIVTVMRDGAVVRQAEVGQIARHELIEAMVGRKIEDLYPARERRSGEVVLEVRNVRVPGKVWDASLTVRRGEVVGLFGLVGAGRTELVRALVGADRLAGGTVRLSGREVRFRSPGQALTSGIAFVPEDRKRQGIVPLMSVASNIGLSSLGTLSRAKAYLSHGAMDRLASSYVQNLRIRTPSVHQSMANLSGGNQQKCIIARVLASDPDVVILDEPTRGIDVGARTEVYRLINELCTQGKGVLMVTSDLPEAMGMSDHIVVMRQGRVQGALDAAEASEARIMTMAFGSEADPIQADKNTGMT